MGLDKDKIRETLMLPKTDFPMKADLTRREPLRYKRWRSFAYHLMNKKSTSPDKGGLCESGGGESDQLSAEQNASFVLHDGPPYANGHLHMGHALNKILKDFIIKHNFFSGKRVFYTPGWDCHGLPIEQQVEQEFTLRGHKPTLQEMRNECRRHASRFIDIQREEAISLGVVGDFDNPYQTMDFRFESEIFRTLVKVAKSGLLVQRSKPVLWSWAAKSALAEAEIEYKMKRSDSIFVRFHLSVGALEELGIEHNAFVIVWTTTPWTLPSNVAISFNPHNNYVLTDQGEIVAEKLYDQLTDKGIVSGSIEKVIAATDLENKIAVNPLNGRESRFILGEFVSMSDGTGAVHSSSAHGEEDYFCCLRYELPVLMSVDDGGCFDESARALFRPEVADEFIGAHVFSAQKRIIELLGDDVIKHEVISHSYPHCWRTKKPVIYRATKQWFIPMDKPYHGGRTLRQIALEEIEKVEFHPASGRNRLRSMLENRPDWCISRQRDWGVPIALFVDKDSMEPLLDTEVTDKIAEIFEREGCMAWWEHDAKDLLPPHYDSQRYIKNMDTLDVWFDSGSTWSAVLKSGNYNSGRYPADMYLEGSDQHRGWFQSSLILSCAVNLQAPYKAVITHGFVGDEAGEKMSKSKGNVTSPMQIAQDHGSEIIRLWVANSNYQNDMRISSGIIKQVSDNYLKIRNVIRFMLSATSGMDSIHPDLGEMASDIDKWILGRSRDVFAQIDELFRSYEFAKGFGVLNGFITAELSGVYIDVSKDSLYCDSPHSTKRALIQSTMSLILNNLMHVLAPFLTYTVDEALEHASRAVRGDARNVFELKRLEMPCRGIDTVPEYGEGVTFDHIVKIRNAFNEHIDELKKAKVIRSSLELDIIIPSRYEGCSHTIVSMLMVSNAVLNGAKSPGITEVESPTEGDSGYGRQDNPHSDPARSIENGVRFKAGEEDFTIVKSRMYKCPRCWQFKSDKEENLCERCEGVLSHA